MKPSELYEKIVEILPGAQFERDNNGQLIIYTNLTEVSCIGADGEIIDFELVPYEEGSGVSESVRPGDCE